MEDKGGRSMARVLIDGLENKLEFLNITKLVVAETITEESTEELVKDCELLTGVKIKGKRQIFAAIARMPILIPISYVPSPQPTSLFVTI